MKRHLFTYPKVGNHLSGRGLDGEVAVSPLALRGDGFVSLIGWKLHTMSRTQGVMFPTSTGVYALP